VPHDDRITGCLDLTYDELRIRNTVEHELDPEFLAQPYRGQNVIRLMHGHEQRPLARDHRRQCFQAEIASLRLLLHILLGLDQIVAQHRDRFRAGSR
jgi:hypothetical protein